METAAFYAGASVGGLAAGWLFAAIWRRIAPMSAHGVFWRGMAGLARGMLEAEEARDFLRLYRRLGGSLFGYLGRNLGGLAAGCLPVVVLAFALSPILFGPWDARAGVPQVFPAGAGVLEAGAQGTRLRLAHRAEAVDVPGNRAAVCWSDAQCLLLRSLDFPVTRVEAPAAAGLAAVIVRPDHVNRNPLFPYLNDPEFAFFGMTVVGAVAGFAVPRRRK